MFTINRVLFFLLILLMELHALEIQQKYYYSDNNITKNFLYGSDEFSDETLFSMPEGKERERMKCSYILAYLKDDNVSCEHSYVEFTKKSTIDTSQLKKRLLNYYKSYYPSIDIKYMTIHPKSYMKELPDYFTFKIRAKSYKRAKGTFYIIDESKHREFFDYYIDAEVNVLQASRKLRRSELISSNNATLKKIHFNSFRDRPITKDELNIYESVHNIAKNRIITQRDIKKVFLVKRHESVILQIKNGPLIVETSAIATQNGQLNDIITIEKADRSRLKARVVSKGRVEIR